MVTSSSHLNDFDFNSNHGLAKIDKFQSIDSDISLQSTERSSSSLSDFTASGSDSDSGIISDNTIDSKLEFLKWVDPHPMKPPVYDSVNPSRRVSFPVYESRCTNILPPCYTPAVDDLTVVSMRLEYVDPETHSSLSKSKVWSNFIVEINSTQLNFYTINKKLTAHIPSYANNINPLNNNRFIPLQTYKFTRRDKSTIIDNVRLDREHYLNSATLFKTYTLQHADFGVPSDYIRRKRLKYEEINILRVRCETQQFLLNFTDIDEMIQWSTYLSVGISISLDLDVRELPDYKIFPRRRSRTHRRRSDRSDSVSESTNSISRSTSSLSSSSSSSNTSSQTQKNTLLKSFTGFFIKQKEAKKTSAKNVRSHPSTSVAVSIASTQPSIISSIAVVEDGNNAAHDDEMEHDEDDTDDFYSDTEEDDDIDSSDVKWTPTPKTTSRERYISTSLRCLRVFNETHSWLGKIILKESQSTPKYQTNNLPIYYINNRGKEGSNKLMIQNHSLNAYVLSPNGLIKHGSRVFDLWYDMYK